MRDCRQVRPEVDSSAAYRFDSESHLRFDKVFPPASAQPEWASVGRLRQSSRPVHPQPRAEPTETVAPSCAAPVLPSKHWLVQYSEFVANQPLKLLTRYAVGTVAAATAAGAVAASRAPWRQYDETLLSEETLQVLRGSFSDNEAQARRTTYEAMQQAWWGGGMLDIDAPPRSSTSSTEGPDEDSSSEARKRLITSKQLTVIYVATRHDALHKRVLREVRDFEERLRSLPSWKSLCNQSAPIASEHLCDPGTTFAAFVWPSVLAVTPEKRHFLLHDLIFDASGTELFEPAAMFAYFALRGANPSSYSFGQFFPITDQSFERNSNSGSSPARPTMLRSRFTFKMVVGDTASSASAVSKEAMAFHKQYTEFIRDEVDYFVRHADYKYVKIYCAGDGVHLSPVQQVIRDDARLFLCSIVFVFVHGLLHTWSFVLSLLSLLLFVCSTSFACIVSSLRIPLGGTAIALFLTTGVWNDPLFTFACLWDQSSEIGSLDRRIAFVLYWAGCSVLFETCVATCGLLLCFASPLQLIRDAALFTAICIVSSFALAVLFFPPALILRARMLNRKGRVGHVTRPPARRHQVCRRCFDKLLMQLVVARRAKRLCCFVAFASSFLGVATMAGSSVAWTLPEMLPSEHALGESHRLQMHFSDEPSPNSALMRGAVCSPTASENEAACILRWCNRFSEQQVQSFDGFRGTCWRVPRLETYSDIHGCSSLNISVQLVIANAEAANQWANSLMVNIVRRKTHFANITYSSRVTELQPLALEDWQTGAVRVKPVFNLGSAIAHDGNVSQSRTDSCYVELMCFSGADLCESSSWIFWGQYALPQQATSVSARPAAATLPASAQGSGRCIEVAVIWGLRPEQSHTSTPFVFDASFDAEDPRAQEAMLAFCQGVTSQLQVLTSHCWITAFHDWLRMRGQQFPSRTGLVEWAHASGESFRTLRVDHQRVVAAKFTFLCRLSGKVSLARLLDHMGHWHNYVAARNANATATANAAWATCSIWPRAVAAAQVIDGFPLRTAIGIIVLGLLLLVILCEPSLAFLSSIIVVFNAIGLVAIATITAGGSLDPIYILFLPFFLSYYLSYSLRIIAFFYMERAGAQELLGSGPLAFGRGRGYAIGALDPEKDISLSRTSHPRSDSGPGASKLAKECTEGSGPSLPFTGRSIESERTLEPQPLGNTMGHSDGNNRAYVELARNDPPEDRLTTSSVPVAMPVHHPSGNQDTSIASNLSIAETRGVRVEAAVRRIRASVLGSCISNIGRCIFLLFCDWIVLSRLGCMAITGAAVSAFSALVVVPAALTLFGPQPRFSLLMWHLQHIGT